VVLARLAADRAYHGRSLGRALLHAANAIGIRGIVVHAISDDAKAFYLALGFERSPIEPMTLVVTLADIRKSSCLRKGTGDRPIERAHGSIRSSGLFAGLSFPGFRSLTAEPPPFWSMNSAPSPIRFFPCKRGGG
jgi:hypothetical protein